MAEVFLFAKFNNDNVVVKFPKSGNFSVLICLLSRSFCGLDLDYVRVTFSVPGHSNCLLRDDSDVQNMVSIVDSFGLKSVDVDVNFSGTVGLSSDRECLIDGGRDDHVGSTNTVRSKAVARVHTVCDNDFTVELGQSSSSKDLCLLSSNWSNVISHVGQFFCGGAAEFRSALCRLSVRVGFKFTYLRNNKERVKAICSEKYGKGCEWYISAAVSRVNGYFYVKKFVNEHSCGILLADHGAQRLSYNIIADLILDQSRINNALSAKDVVNVFKTHYGVDIPYKRAWKALEKARGMIFGDAAESFKLLRWYVDAALSNNPGSHIVLEVDGGSNRFRRIFISFYACIHGFHYCRPMLFLDGTFLKGRFKGVILSATGKDGNQGLYPLAFAVVDSETHDNWLWFLGEVRKIVGDGRKITLLSDRNVGLMEAIPKVFPDGHHFFCLQHLKSNLRDKFNGSSFPNSLREHLVWLFRECAHATSETTFAEKLNELRRQGGPIVDRFLEGLPFRNWTNAYSQSCRYGEMSSNAAESFNAWILEVRDLPITYMIDRIRVKLMEWFSERRKLALSWNGSLCPKMLGKLNGFATEGLTWGVRKCSENIFEITSSPSVMVDVKRRTCSCRYWQLNGFPCVHATVAIYRCSLKLEEMVEQYFHVTSYKKMYEECIHPVPSILLSEMGISAEVDDIVAPAAKRPPGRPRKRRFRSRGELVRRIKCGRCGKLGTHNRKTCKEPLQ